MYAKSRYKGPSARITKRSKVKHFFSIFVRIGLPVFLLTMIVVFLRADFMQIKKVAVAGNKDVRTEEVEKLALASLTGKYFFLIPKSNFLFFKKSALSQKILADLPRVENLEISKNLNVPISSLEKPVNGPLNFYCDVEKTKKVLEWEPKTSLEEGMKNTVEYIKNKLSK